MTQPPTNIRRLSLGVMILALVAAAVGAVVPSSASAAPPRPAQAVDPATTTALQPVTPCRLFDSRETPNAGRVDASTWRIQVSGRCNVPDGTSAAALIVTATEPTVPGFVTVWPAGGARPVVSNLNVIRGNTVANSAVVQLSATGAVDVYTQKPMHVVIDVTGAFVPSPSATLAAVPRPAPKSASAEAPL